MLIGVLDSGIGGWTTLQEIIRVRGGGDYLYLADTAHCPYGNKSAEEVTQIVRAAAMRLMAEGAEAIVLACNTATACAIDELRREFEEIIFVGTEPCINIAKTYGNNLCVLATPLTLSSPRFARLIQGVNCTLPDCSDLAREIELSYPHLAPAYKLLDKILSPYRSRTFDACVLGCTHYCLVKKQVRAILRCPVLDGNNGVARRLRRLCGAANTPARVREII